MSSANLAQGVSDIRFIAARFKGFLAAAEALEKLGSIEGAIDEAQARLAALARDEEAAKTAIKRAHSQADLEISQKHDAAALEIEGKHRNADDLIADAEQKAARILSAARDEAAGFAERVEAHKITIGSLGEEITRLKAEIAGHDQDRDRAKADAAEAKRRYEGEIARLRSFRASLPPVE